jgi:hypothetical protein
VKLPTESRVVVLPGLGRVRFEIPELREDWPPSLREAAARRRVCIIRGRCPCGARGEIVKKADGGLTYRFEHSPDCHAEGRRLREIAAEAGLDAVEV